MTTTKSLCEICLPKQWKTISTDMLMDEGFPVYGANGVIGCYSEYNHEHPTLLVTCRGATCGTLNICQPYSYVNGNAMALDNLIDEVDINFLYYYLLNRGFEDVITGSAQPQIVRQSLQKVSVTYPSKEKQREIVITLEKVSELIALRKEQLAKLDQLVKSRFIELFGNTRDNEKDWSMVSLKSVAEVRGRVGWKGYKKEDLRESGPLVLGATHLTESGCIDLSAPVYLSREKYEESPEIMLQKNDLIFTQRGNTIGKVGLVEDDIGEATINPCVLILRPLAINPIYFKTYFIMNETKSDMWSLNAGSAQPMITQKGIGEYMLMLPPIELQNQFAAFVKQTDKSKLAIQQSLDKLELLKKSLMQEYFG